MQQLLAHPLQNGHQWEHFRSGAACKLCKQRLHTKSLIQELRDALTMGCAAQVVQPVKRETRIKSIEEIIDGQTSPVPGKHHILLDRAYVRCSQCKSYVLARRAQEHFDRWLQEPCYAGPLEAACWHGHPSHTMERLANRVMCTRCKTRTRVVEGRIELNDRLRNRCQLQGSQDLRKFFG